MGSVLLGGSLLMELTALSLRAASVHHGNDFVAADYALNITSAILAFPAGVVTGVYLSRSLLARKLVNVATKKGSDEAPHLTLAPIISTDTFGFWDQGCF